MQEDVLLPLNRFEHGLPSETTGFYMRRVLNVDVCIQELLYVQVILTIDVFGKDIIAPWDTRYAVAVVRGLHVGYFKSW